MMEFPFLFSIDNYLMYGFQGVKRPASHAFPGLFAG